MYFAWKLVYLIVRASNQLAVNLPVYFCLYISTVYHNNQTIACKYSVREKGRDIWLSPMTKELTPTEKFKNQRDNSKRHQKLR